MFRREADLEAEVARLETERATLRAALQQCVDHERMNALKYEQTYGTDALHGDLHIERALAVLGRLSPSPSHAHGDAEK